MTALSGRLRQIHWYHWLVAALILIYIIYIALSYLYLPKKIKHVMETDASAFIGRSIHVESIDFNPFVLSLKVGRFSVEDTLQSPLVGWQQLFVNFDFWKSLFAWKIALDEVILDQIEINIGKNQERFNFSDIIERFNTHEGSEDTPLKQPARSPSIAFEIFHIVINQGSLRFVDFSGTNPARFNLNDITIEMENMYIATGDENLNPFHFMAKIPDGGEARISGRYRIDPLHVDAQIAANDIQLSAFSEFVENIIPIKVSNGLLSVNTRILAKLENELQLHVEQGRVSLNDLTLDDNVADPTLLHVDSINAGDIALDFPQQQVTVNSVTLESITTNQWLDKTGKLRYEYLIDRRAEEMSPQVPIPRNQQKSSKSWNVLVKKMGLKNSTLNFSDQKDAITRSHSLTGITLDLEDVNLTPETPVHLQFAAMLDEQGRIHTDGTLSLSPFSMNLNYNFGEIQLPPFSEYLETAAFLRIEKGNLSIDGNAALRAEDGIPLHVATDIRVNGLQVEDTRTGHSLIDLQTCKVNDILVDTSSKKVSIASISMVKPEVFVEMSQDKKLNFTSLIKSSEVSPPEIHSGKERNRDADWAYSMKKMELNNGTIHFKDKSVKPTYETGLHDLELAVGEIAANRLDPTPFSLTSKIDQYAPFTLKGTLDPIDKQPGFSFTSELKGLEMPSLSSYSATYIGNKLRSGQLSLALDYSLQNHKLNGKNNIVAKNLYLGEEVPGEPVIKAPVGLGLALLRDVNGIIDLNVGLSGDLDDPEFSISGVIIKILVNIIVKAAAAPFKLLGALVGGGENLGEIEFTGGHADLDQENQLQLKKLAEALAERPNLALTIKGNAAVKSDAEMLQSQRMMELIAASRKIPQTKLIAEAGSQALWTVPENREALDRMNDELNLKPASERVLQIQEENSKLTDEALTNEVYRQIYEDVKAKQVIGTEDLLSLADRRAFSIKQYLVDMLQFDHERVSVLKTRESDLTGRSIKLELNAM